MPIEDYQRMLAETGFAHVEVIDSGRDLNAYAKVKTSRVVTRLPHRRCP